MDSVNQRRRSQGLTPEGPAVHREGLSAVNPMKPKALTRFLAAAIRSLETGPAHAGQFLNLSYNYRQEESGLKLA